MRIVKTLLAGTATLVMVGWASGAAAQTAPAVRSIEDCAQFATQQDRRDCAQDFVNDREDDSDGPNVAPPDDDSAPVMGGGSADDDDDDDGGII
jgi:hypothetical protein